ncbi:MAG: type II toxin-antitoxin system VapB family antitoxin [Burkholderiaceae bacterium]
MTTTVVRHIQMLYTCLLKQAIHCDMGVSMAIGTVFINNRTQAIRLPVEVRLPEGIRKVDIRVRGNERIIAPVDQTWDSFFLNGPVVSDDFLSERASQQQTDRESL